MISITGSSISTFHNSKVYLVETPCMALPKKAVATLPFALGSATLGSSKIGRDAMGDLSTKLGLKAAEKPLRNLAGNMFERAANVGAKKIQKALSPLGELQLRTLPGLEKYNY